MYAASGRKRPRRTSYAPHSRSWGGKGLQGPKAEKGPSRRQEAAEDALTAILEMFDSGELPEMIARTCIARLEGLAPCANWSLGNQLLMLRQGTTDARGFQQWKEVARNVCKGSKAVYILAPLTRKRTEKDAETGEEMTRPFVAGFVGVPVFRYEDTEGLPIEREQYDPPAMPPLFEVAGALGVSVVWAPFATDALGFYQPNRERIVLCSHDENVFLHELAHAAHRRVLQARGADLAGGQSESQEVVAEVVAATLCKLYGLDGYLWHGAEYVRSYAADKSPAKAALRVLGDVQAVLYLIIEAAGEAGANVPEPVAA